MKIQKALEIARQVRGIQEKTKSVAPDQSTKKVEWNPPKYTQSRNINLDPEVLARNRCVCRFPDSPYQSSFKVIRTQILNRMREIDGRTLMFTSVREGEGKTLISINLALTFAKDFGLTVLLMDCDLRRQDVHRYLGIDSNMSLVDHLLYQVPLQDLIIWPGIDKMTLISGSKTVPESADLLTSTLMKSLVDDVKNRYSDRYVIFEAPSLFIGTDAFALSFLVDCIVMVVEAGKTTLPDIKRALELIPKEKFLGFVLNQHNP